MYANVTPNEARLFMCRRGRMVFGHRSMKGVAVELCCPAPPEIRPRDLALFRENPRAFYRYG